MKSTNAKTWILRCLFLVLACAICVLAAKWLEKAQSHADAEGSFLPGVYTAEANGFGGPVKVALTIGEQGGIADVQIQGQAETPDVGGAAMPLLAKKILNSQSADIDGVSSATFTSNAVKEAAAKALTLAAGGTVDEGPKPQGDDLFVPGTYTGVSTGFGGEVKVTATLSGKKIEDIQIEGTRPRTSGPLPWRCWARRSWRPRAPRSTLSPAPPLPATPSFAL